MKRTFALLTAFVILFSLCACGAPSADVTPSIDVSKNGDQDCFSTLTCTIVYQGLKTIVLSGEQIVQASLGGSYLYILNKNGTLSRINIDDMERTDNLYGWTDIRQISAGFVGLLGIKNDGTVLYEQLYDLFDYSEQLKVVTQRPGAICVTETSYEKSNPAVLYSDGTIIPFSANLGSQRTSLQVPGAKDIFVPSTDTVYVLMPDGALKLFLYFYPGSQYYIDYGIIATDVRKVSHSFYGEFMAILYEDGTVQLISPDKLYDHIHHAPLTFESSSELQDYIQEECCIETYLKDLSIDDILIYGDGYNIALVVLTSDGEVFMEEITDGEVSPYLEHIGTAKALEDAGVLMYLS